VPQNNATYHQAIFSVQWLSQLLQVGKKRGFVFSRFRQKFLDGRLHFFFRDVATRDWEVIYNVVAYTVVAPVNEGGAASSDSTTLQ